MLDRIHSRKVKIKCACIVWWDYAGGTKDKPWDIVMQWKKEWHVPPHQIKAGLLRLGYAEIAAARRARQSKYIEY